MEDGNSAMDFDDSSFEFTLAEIMEMENILKDAKDQSLGQEFFQDVAHHFSCSLWRAGKPPITSEQVKGWFENRKIELRNRGKSLPPPSPSTPKLLICHLDRPFITDEPSSKVLDGFPEFVGKATDLSELAYEALSSRDLAWYDVASFLSYRILCTGELEARVRFADFAKDHDEWVSVARGVRERSIPLEPSECYRVKVGDLVLCYRQGQDSAMYFDAYVVEIQRRLHDIGGCRCIFVVRYDHDGSEEKVHLGRLCCRPSAYNPDSILTSMNGIGRIFGNVA